ncbi:MAG: choice-of-anchor D domain-containing protein, partial [Steroidobacteraceae bacterium]
NLYIADTNNQVIRLVGASTQTIATVAGNGTRGYSGDGGPATAAQLYYPYGVAVDGGGNLYIADSNNQVIRRVDATSQIITTVAGNGTDGYSGDGGPAAAAQLNYPYGVVVDGGGNLYIADSQNSVVRRVDASTQTITTVAGNGGFGYSGDGGPATAAQLSYPFGVAVDGGGNLYIADNGNQAIRRVNASTQTITTVAGNGTFGYSGDGGPAGAAELADPFGLVTNYSGNLFIADVYNNRIREVTGLASGTSSYTLTPSATDFGFQPLNTSSASTTITLSNTGSGALTLGAISVTGTNSSQFSQNNNCGPSVAVGTSCAIQVVFSPSAVGAQNASLGVTAGGGAGSEAVALSGTGVRSKYTLTPSALAFGDEAHGTSSVPQSLTITNTGTVVLPITSIVLGGKNSPQFSQNNTCGGSVASGASCAINVTFKPSVQANVSATVVVTMGGGAASKTVKLSGTGVIPTYTLAPPALAFPNEARGTSSAPLASTLTNSGPVALPVTSIDLAGADPTQFSKSTTCGASVASGASCAIYVIFKPTSLGIASATVSVNTGADAGTQTVTLSGTGAVPTYTLAPTALAFGNQRKGTSSAPQPLTLTNTGSVTLLISSIGLPGTQFSQANTCGGSVASGASCTINVTFNPTGKGSRTATLTVHTTGGAGTQAATLSGTGT